MRIVIADDEELARERLESLVSATGAEVVASCANGEEALRAVRSTRPDVVLLDVEMPKLSGFEVVESLSVDPMPAVIFVTAFDQYAIRAFEAHAVDYLLKPVHRRRLAETLARVKSQLRPREPLTRLLVRSGTKMRLLNLSQVEWIEAAGNYVRLHLGDQAFTHRMTLTELEERLPPRAFCRVSRAAIVNITRIDSVHRASHGDLTLVLCSGAQVKLTRTHRDQFEAMTGG